MTQQEIQKIFGNPVLSEEDIKEDFGPALFDIKLNSAAALNGISDVQRSIAKNFFDTQPKRRAAYFKQLGYQLNPKNPEEYRPIGSDSEFVNIEPSGSEVEFDVFGLFKIPNLATKKGRAEFKRDVTDVGFDLGFEGPAEGLAAVQAGAIGAASGAPLGPAGVIGGGFLGAFTGGAAAKAAVEGVKNSVGDYFLDDEVPMDLKETFVQSLTSGVFAGGGKVIGNFFKKMELVSAKDRLKMLKEITARRANGNFNDNMMSELVNNPENFQPEKVIGAQKELGKMFKRLFGTSVEAPHTTKQLGGKGLLAKPIKKLNKQADLETDRLSQEPLANFDFEELANIALDATKGIRSKRFPSMEEKKAVKFLRDSLLDVREQSTRKINRRVNPETGETALFDDEVLEINFKEGRDILKTWQNAAFTEGPLKDNRVLKGVTANFKNSADLKADALGSPLATINEKRSRILAFYPQMRKTITKGRFQNAYIGKDNIQKEEVREMFGVVDDIVGSNLREEVSSKQYQAAMEGLFKTPTSFGSGAVFPDALKGGAREAVKQAFAFATIGSVIPGVGTSAGAQTGAIKGFIEGAIDSTSFSSPKKLANAFIKKSNRVDKIFRGLSEPENIKEIARRGITNKSTSINALGGDIKGAEQINKTIENAQQPQEAPAPSPQDQLLQNGPKTSLQSIFGEATLSKEEVKSDFGQ